MSKEIMSFYSWEQCPEHNWQEPMDSQCESTVVCTNCGMPGDKDPVTGNVFFPAT